MKIKLSGWRWLLSRHLGNYAKECAIKFCERTEVNELYFYNIEKNLKRLKKFVEYVKAPKRFHTFKGYEDFDFLFCFVMYIIRNDEQILQSVQFLEFAIQVSNFMANEAQEANEIDYYNDVIQFRKYVSEIIEKIKRVD